MADGGSSRVTIDRVDMGEGYVCFQAGKQPPAPEELPYYLHRALQDWLRRNSEFRIRTAMPIVANGQTVAIHVWFD